ncbi:shikimate kinase [Georgenia sp. TF02-10]|uniref:shikimate kinase n=1 Tax=Georgenia sp. TF02-10 TaxID=2917725 RepID=UPI001FA6B712|nr:shikimate kinase [Georgenia sp. TF02-10]UNX53232.1 shikimate kinase [Georgenia sp. TF02-10]
MSAPTVILIGPPGAGKSVVAGEIGRRLGLPVVDTDEALAERAGTTVGDLFLDLGEEVFRERERAVVADAMARPGVLALGSGAVAAATDELDRYRADGGTVVFLDVALSAAVPRLGLNAPRAVVVGSPRATFAALAEARRPVYAAAASRVVDTTNLGVAEVADAVVVHLGATRAEPGALPRDLDPQLSSPQT